MSFVAVVYDLCGAFRQSARSHTNNGAPSKRRVAWIGLDLNSQVRARLGDVDAVGELLDAKAFSKRRLSLFEVLANNGKVKVQADNRLGIGVDCLAADDRKLNSLRLEDVKKLFQETRLVPCHSLPKSGGLHESLVVAESAQGA